MASEETIAATGGPTGAAAASDGADDLSRGTVVGRYLLLDRLGAGGMGVVFAAYDPELDRKIALKLLLPRAGGNTDSQGQTRLLREAQALAKLSHPNVVAVHDVGTYNNRVWIAMEFVAGQTLGAWGRERPRRWREVLQVLTDAARGVAAAHAAGLVHRDLKPDNVMIGGDGRVRVMDFGLVHGRLSARTEPEVSALPTSGGEAQAGLPALLLRLTAVGSVQGTPAYMAPEQWHGDEAEAAVDQFGWSVMAWELLHGERPFGGETAAALAAMVVSGQRRPPPRGRRVPGWLRRIVERGLAVDPTRRWPTMTALVTQLERGTSRARTRTTVAVLAVAAALAAAAEAYRRWDVAQHVAACEAAGAVIDAAWTDDTRQRLRDAFAATGVSYAAAAADKVLPWLDEHAAAWRRARTGACMNTEVHARWPDDTYERAEGCLEDRRIAFESLVGELTQANATTVQRAVSAAANLRSVDACMDEGLLQRQPALPREGREAIREARASLSRASALALAGKFKEALELATEVRETAPDWPPLWAAARDREGLMRERMGAYDEAETASAEAYFAAARAGEWEVAVRAALGLTHLVGYRRARHADGRAWAKHAEVAIAQVGGRSDRWESERLNSVAAVADAAGESKEAQGSYARALAIDEAMLGPDHPQVAQRLTNLANTHAQLGDHATARALYERALAIQERAFGREHPDVATSLNNIATVHFATGTPAEARPLLERALVIWENALGPDHPFVAGCLGNLGTLDSMVGDPAGARMRFERALAIRERTLGPDHPDVAANLSNLGVICEESGAYTQAGPLHARALAIRERAFGPDHPIVATSLHFCGRVHLALHEPAAAVPLLERAVAILGKREDLRASLAAPSFNLARALVAARRDHPRALAAAQRSRDLYREAGASKAKELAEVEAWLAEHERGKR